MPQVIWKFPLEVADGQMIEMPAHAKILHVQMQDGKPCLWAYCDPEQPKQPRLIRTIGTGHPIPDESLTYIGTYQTDGGRLVWHVFEVPNGL